MDDIVKVCDPLWGAVIKKVNFNFFNKKIKFYVTSIDEGNETNHTLEIRDYESLLWIERSPDTHVEYDFKNCDYYEFTAITFRNVQAESDDKWLKHYSLNYNVVIEIWESVLLIKANKISVDGREFYLKTVD